MIVYYSNTFQFSGKMWMKSMNKNIPSEAHWWAPWGPKVFPQTALESKKAVHFFDSNFQTDEMFEMGLSFPYFHN